MRRLAFAILPFLLTACSDPISPPDPPLPPDDDLPAGPPRVLVVNGLSWTISSLDPDSDEMTVQAAVAGAWANRITRAGARFLVTSSGANRIELLRELDLAPAGVVDVGPGRNPWTAVPISGERALVTNWLAGDVQIIDLAGGGVGPALATTPGPEGAVIIGNTAWVACTNWQGDEGYGDGRVVIVDLAAWSILASIPVAKNPQEVLLASDGRVHVLCTGTYGNDAVPEPGRVQIIDAASRTQVAEVPLGGAPGRFVEAEDGTIWVAGFEGGIRRYRTDTLELLPDPEDPTLAGVGFTGIDVDPATGTVYVSNFDADLLLALDGESAAITGAWLVGDGPVDVLAHRP